MDQPQGEKETSGGTQPNKQIISSSVESPTEKKQKSEASSNRPSTTKHKNKNPKNTLRRKIKRYFLTLVREEPDRHVELFLALVIAIFAAVQWYTSWSNNSSTTQQTAQLIVAAKISAIAAKENTVAAQQIADASRRNATAAQSFSGSAAGINDGISDAVEKLQSQAEKMDAARTASVQESQQSLQATIDNFHLEQRAWLGISDIQTEGGRIIDGKDFTFDKVSFVIRNTGRTPAIHLSIHCCRAVTKVFDDPVIPDYDSEIAKDRKALEENFPPSPESTKAIDKIMNMHETGGRESFLEQSLAPDSFRKIPIDGHTVYENVEGLRTGSREAPPKGSSSQVMLAWIEAGEPKNIFMLGKIVYSDVFTGTPIHTTTICLLREGVHSGGFMTIFGGGLTFEECPTGRMD